MCAIHSWTGFVIVYLQLSELVHFAVNPTHDHITFTMLHACQGMLRWIVKLPTPEDCCCVINLDDKREGHFFLPCLPFFLSSLGWQVLSPVYLCWGRLVLQASAIVLMICRFLQLNKLSRSHAVTQVYIRSFVRLSMNSLLHVCSVVFHCMWKVSAEACHANRWALSISTLFTPYIAAAAIVAGTQINHTAVL